MIRHLVRQVKQLLFPLHCPVCDEIVVPYGEKICPTCLPKIKYLTQPYCMKCGKKLQQEGELCADCVRIGHAYIRGRALYEYESISGSIYRLKYRGRQEYAEFFGEEFSYYLGDYIRRIKPDALIPVPLHKMRLRKRGYNQSERLAKVLGRRLSIPVYDHLVVRCKKTVPMKLLNPKERQKNLKNAFIIKQNDVKLKTVLIVDDIYTTGSTIDEMARTLMRSGVKNVYYIALACGAGI